MTRRIAEHNDPKHLLVGPGQKLPDNADGYNVIPTKTYHNMILIRIMDPDPVKAAKLREAFQVYPYVDRASPKRTKIVPAAGRKWKSTQPEGYAYWEVMSWMINQEPVNERDRLIMGMLKPLGIEKGKPFKPCSPEENP